MEEVEDGVGKGGWKLQTEASLPKHLGHVIGSLCGVSSVWGLVWQYGVLVDLVSPWSWSQRISLSTSGLHPGHVSPFGPLSLMWPPTLPRQIPINA